MSNDPGFLPGQRLWTPWRMAYVGGGTPTSGCVFCNAPAEDDDAANLVLFRGEHAFVILNLFPYNTGHLMVVPYQHVNDLAMLSPEARAEMAELTASFCTGLKLVMGCDGLNTGMNLGTAAGAGIADHLHQHVVPRWSGDANFMPIVGATKVLPEMIAATYGKLRAELARQRTNATSATVVLVAEDRSGLYLDSLCLPSIELIGDQPVWKSIRSSLTPIAASFEVLGWGGPSTVNSGNDAVPMLAASFSPHPSRAGNLRLVQWSDLGSSLTPEDLTLVETATRRFQIDPGQLGSPGSL